MNIGVFAGRVGRDSELKATPNGKELLEFSLAVTVGWGERKETQWVKATLWGERGKKLEQYIKKGTALTLVGRIKSNAYTSKDSALKSEIVCDVLELTLQGGAGDSSSSAEKSEPAKPAAKPAAEWGFDDEIPI